MKMKKKILSAAVLAALGAGTAQAVNLSQDGHGEVLLFPYYTVQNGEETLVSIVNTTDYTKAVKIRFREAMNSREVLDFNLYLSPHDVWTGKVQDDGNGGAKIVTNDKSCTVPAIPAGGVSFRTYEFDGSKVPPGWDGGPTDVGRTREGYVEMIEMGVAADTLGGNDMISDGVPVAAPWDGTGNGIPDSTHVAGVPENCATLIANWAPGGAWTGGAGAMGLNAPEGGLFGAGAVINVGTGTEISTGTTVLDEFSNTVIHSDPGSLSPSLASVNPARSVVIVNDGVADAPTAYVDTWPFPLNAIDAVTAVLQTEAIMNEYTVNPAVEAETDWVVTFPTKWAYVNTGAEPAIRPFTDDFLGFGFPILPDGRSCEPVVKTYFDREERFVQGDIDFSPLPPGTSFDLCWEVNVVEFGGSNALSAENTDVAFTLADGFNAGWAALGFTDPGHALPNPVSGNVYLGLPGVGFRATKLGNSNVGVGASYAVSEEHKYLRIVSGVGTPL